jgi:hypothetical protein
MSGDPAATCRMSRAQLAACAQAAGAGCRGLHRARWRVIGEGYNCPMAHDLAYAEITELRRRGLTGNYRIAGGCSTMLGPHHVRAP